MTNNGRIWVGPLLLIIIIALIYIFSLIPHTHTRFHDYDAPSRNHLQDSAEFLPPGDPVAKQKYNWQAIAESLQNKAHPELSEKCHNRGVYNATSELCSCDDGYVGKHCETPVCVHGVLNVTDSSCDCSANFFGPHCDVQCTGGVVNKTTGECDCFRRFFGRTCELICINGVLLDGHCRCYEGYMGVSCTACDPAYHGQASLSCGIPERRRGSVNSRLTLSGISFCMITIGLLCVTAKRRRFAGNIPPSEDTWYRVFQPQSLQAARRCRHEFICGGAWMPRDRALLVTPNSTTARVTRNTNRSATPPPSYCTVENVQEAPPTYEEALQRAQPEERVESEKEETVVYLGDVDEQGAVMTSCEEPADLPPRLEEHTTSAEIAGSGAAAQQGNEDQVREETLLPSPC